MLAHYRCPRVTSGWRLTPVARDGGEGARGSGNWRQQHNRELSRVATAVVLFACASGSGRRATGPVGSRWEAVATENRWAVVYSARGGKWKQRSASSASAAAVAAVAAAAMRLGVVSYTSGSQSVHRGAPRTRDRRGKSRVQGKNQSAPTQY